MPDTLPVDAPADPGPAEAPAPPEHTSAVIVGLPDWPAPLHPSMPLDELHVTLAFLGKAADVDDARRGVLEGAVGRAASTFNGPVECAVIGAGTLGVDGAVVVFLEAEDLPVLHLAAVAAAGEAQVDLPDQHPTFIPHMTVAYPVDDADRQACFELANALIGQVVTITDLGVWWAGNRFTSPLAAPDTTAPMPHPDDEPVPGDQPAPQEAPMTTRRFGSKKAEFATPPPPPGPEGAAEPVEGSTGYVAADGMPLDVGHVVLLGGNGEIGTEAVVSDFDGESVLIATLDDTGAWTGQVTEALPGELTHVLDEAGNPMIDDVPSDAPPAPAAPGGAEALTAAGPAALIPWDGPLVVEGRMSGDRRTIDEGALTWRDLPLPFMWMDKNPVGGEGHDGAELAGRIDRIERKGDQLWGWGVVDPALPGGTAAAYQLENGYARGVSVDLDQIDAVLGDDESFRVLSARIMGATGCPFPAFQEAGISITQPAAADPVALAAGKDCEDCPDGMPCASCADDALAASAGQLTASVWTPWGDPVRPGDDALVASAGARFPVAPPLAWFQAPPKDAPVVPVRIDPETGQIAGYAAVWSSCHIGFAGKCVAPPRSRAGYRYFQTGQTATAEGVKVATGPVVMNTVHPSLVAQASDAQAFYAHTGAVAGDVAVYETKDGIYLAGAARPDVSPVNVRAFNSSDGVSPDWRRIDGHMEAVAMLAVPNSGFKIALVASAAGGDVLEPGVPAARFGADGELLALVAAGAVPVPDPVEVRLAALEEQLARLAVQVRPLRSERARRIAAALIGDRGPA